MIRPVSIRSARLLRISLLAGAGSLALAAAPAWADCVADSTGLVVTCSGTSAAYSNPATGVSLTAQTGGTVTGPVVLGNTATVSNAGTFNATAGNYALTVGTNSAITNTGTLTSAGTTAGSGTINAGAYSTVTNSGNLAGVAGLPVINFAKGGTFINTASATAAVTGQVQFGLNTGTDVGSFTNRNTASGFSGSVIAIGNLAVDNAGLFVGSITQTATSVDKVTILNEAAGTFSGTIATGDSTQLTNAGTMTLTTASSIGLPNQVGTSIVNNGTLTLGTATAPIVTQVYGGFTQNAGGTLTIPLTHSTTGSAVAGSSYSQIYATGTTGTATLGGTLALVPTAGFYPTGSTYNVVLADQGITGNFASITGNSLAFITFVPVGVVTVSGTQQAYQLQVVRSATYASALSGVGTPAELAIATGLQPLVATATANPTSDAATLVGQIDVLTVPQAQAFLDSLSPADYLAYAAALRDQADLVQRAIALRMGDNHANADQRGWWLQGIQQFHFGSTAPGLSKQSVTGFVGGYDYSGANYVLGASLGYVFDSLRNSSATLAGHTTGVDFGIYGGYSAGPLIARGELSYIAGHLGGTKTIALGSATRTASAGAPVHMLTATGTLGLNLIAGKLEFDPFAGISYHNGSISSFTESGASAADLTVARIGATRTDALAGATVTTSGGKWRPYAKAAYRSALGSDSSTSVSATINGDPTTAFTVSGVSAARHQIDVDAGLNIVYEDQGNLFIGYQGTFRKDLKSHGVMAGLRLEF